MKVDDDCRTDLSLSETCETEIYDYLADQFKMFYQRIYQLVLQLYLLPAGSI